MTPPPAWFSAALAAPVQEGVITVDGASIAYRAWGDPDGRSIVLVHGGAAHSRWWDHIAPMLTDGWRVVAVDLSGHGDSDRRDRYSLDTWAREVLAVLRFEHGRLTDIAAFEQPSMFTAFGLPASV